MRRQLSYAVGIFVVAVVGLIYTFAAGNEPLLGIDLQGGVSVVLEPKLEPGEPTPDDDVLEQAVNVIRNRVDGLGVREPEIIREGTTVLVQLPGVEEQARAIDLVGQTAELRFRPVILDGAVGDDFSVAAAAFCTPADGDELPAAFASGTATPDAPAGECMLAHQFTTIDDVEIESLLLLGPAPELLDPESAGERLTGAGVETASARLGAGGNIGEWGVNLVMNAGSPGIDDFNALAAQCVSRIGGCQTGRVAVEIDGEVESAPTIQAASFSRDQIQISGSFSEGEAKDLALVLRFGSLPVSFEPQDAEAISSTLGEDALQAGIVAGLIGFGLVSLYLIAYYRILGLVAIASLAISGALLWTMVAWLGETQGLALTLAGVTGLIVSVGVSVDSNVVYFEHLKEDVRGGRTVRSAVDRAFPIAYSTIVKADVASLIAAVVLYFLTVGQVKGFALFLGLATVLDLVATYFFMGPAIRVLARRDGMTDNPGRYGIPGEVAR